MLQYKRFTGRLHLSGYNYITSSGVIVPDTDTVLAEVQAEWQAVFGVDLDLTPSTPQGLMISAETLTRVGVARNNADLANQINPNIATGVFLDAIAALSGLARTVATHTTVTATIVGDSGTIIYAGALASTSAGDLFECTTATTIPIGGTITAPFRSVSTGPIPCAIGALNTIVDGILGWASITNAAAGILGTSEQADTSFWLYRKNTLALQGISTNEAIISAIYNVAGVQSLAYRENTASTTVVIDTISMIAHSIYVCVNGGLDADIARALLQNKTAGAGYNGTTTVSTIDLVSGQSYDVKFSRPIAVPILAKITVRLSGATGDPSETIKQRIVDYASGLISGEAGFIVGGAVSPFELSGAAMGIAGVYVLSSEIALVSTGIFQSTEIAIAIDHIATISLSSVQVVLV